MKKTFFILLFLYIGVWGFSQTTQQDSIYNLSLEQAQTLALQRNKQVLNSQLEVLKMKKKIWETTAIGLPHVNGSISHNYNIDLPVTLLPARIFNPQAPPGTYMEMRFGTEHNTKVGLSVSQLIFNGQYLVGLQSTRVLKKLTETKLKQTQRDIKYSVAQTYFLVLITQENLKIIDSNYVFVKKLYDDTKKMFDAGFIEEATLKQMKLNFKNVEVARQTLQRQTEVAKNLLKFQIGINLSSKIILTDHLDKFNEEISNAQNLITTAITPDQTIEYQMINTQERLKELSLKNEKATLLPVISAFYNHQESMMGDEIKWFDSDGKWYKANIVGFNINVPIFGSGQKMARIAQAKIDLEETKNQKWQLEQSLQLKILQAKVNLQNAISKYQTQKENKELAEYIYKNTKEKYLKGMASSMDLTQAQIQYFSTLQQYYQSILEYWNAKNELEKLFYK